MAFNILKPLYHPAGFTTWYDEKGEKHRTEQFTVTFQWLGRTNTGEMPAAMASSKKRFSKELAGHPPILERVR